MYRFSSNKAPTIITVNVVNPVNVNTGSCICWVRFFAALPTTNEQAWQIGAGAALRNFSCNVTNGLSFTIARNTTALLANAPLANFANFQYGALLCLAAVWNTGGADADNKVYIGSDARALAEPTVYSNQTKGTGTVGDSSGNKLQIFSFAGTARLWGDVHAMQMWPIYFSQEQLQSKARKYDPSGTAWSYRFLNPTGTTALDDSGNGNHCLVTQVGQAPVSARERAFLLPDLPMMTPVISTRRTLRGV